MTKLVDLTQPWGDRMPTWPQFDSIQVTDITTHHRDGKSTVLVRTNMHTGTHIDAPIHYWPTGKHLGQIPIGDLYGTGLVIDLRPITKPWSYYSLKDVLSCLPKGEQIREGDVVILYTGWDRYNWTKPTRDDVTYFDRHPGPMPEVCDYLIDKKIRWFGGDLASMDHSLYVRVRYFRPDLVKEYEAQTGKPIDETLPMKDFEHVHYHMAKANIPMLENLGGEMAEVAGRRIDVRAFPWRWENGEGCICRVVAFQPGRPFGRALLRRPRRCRRSCSRGRTRSRSATMCRSRAPHRTRCWRACARSRSAGPTPRSSREPSKAAGHAPTRSYLVTSGPAKSSRRARSRPPTASARELVSPGRANRGAATAGCAGPAATTCASTTVGRISAIVNTATTPRVRTRRTSSTRSRASLGSRTQCLWTSPRFATRRRSRCTR